MKITIEATGLFFRTDEGYPVRLWTGTTDQGVLVHAFVSSIATPDPDERRRLEAELLAVPSPPTGSHLTIAEASWPPSKH